MSTQDLLGRALQERAAEEGGSGRNAARAEGGDLLPLKGVVENKDWGEAKNVS
jgi:hypothetical protein